MSYPTQDHATDAMSAMKHYVQIKIGGYVTFVQVAFDSEEVALEARDKLHDMLLNDDFVVEIVPARSVHFSTGPTTIMCRRRFVADSQIRADVPDRFIRTTEREKVTCKVCLRMMKQAAERAEANRQETRR